ncbi:hypothetical protein [Halodurantibacterium flavum]|uniref:HTH DNA binding domain-containing protein n=1 Tax=Halodurantibacterium flavum TaxID=1382802 RepID=A0ABW4S135_9RHOB
MQHPDGSMDEDEEETGEADLWFLPGPPEDEPPGGPLLPPLPRAGPAEGALVAEWGRAEAALAPALARAAARLGALDDRLMRGPSGWRHRLALREAAELSWLSGDRVGPDRMALWLALRLSGVQDDALALSRLGWAVRRLTGGPGPEAGLAEFLGRHDPAQPPDHVDPGQGVPEPLADRVAAWAASMDLGADLHPITRAAMGFHLWPVAGLPGEGALEPAVTAARLATAECTGGAVFAPLALGGAAGLRGAGMGAGAGSGGITDRLARWYDGHVTATLAAMRELDRLEVWRRRAEEVTATLSGRTPRRLLDAFASWPHLSAPMAEHLTGASRAAVQRNITWFEARGLVREVTGQGRYRFWRADL